jgi:hypothetical protein
MMSGMSTKMKLITSPEGRTVEVILSQGHDKILISTTNGEAIAELTAQSVPNNPAWFLYFRTLGEMARVMRMSGLKVRGEADGL